MDASSGTVGRVQSELIYSSQGGTMDASSAAVGEGRKQDERFVSMGCGKRLLGPGREGRKRDERFVSRAENETSGSSQGDAVDASSAPVERTASETSGSSQGVRRTPPRPRQGGPKAGREVRSRERSVHLLDPGKKDPERDDRFVSRGRSGRLLGPGR